MTKKEKKLIADLLRMASDSFSNNGCNDLPENIWDGWTDEERKKLISVYYKANNEPEEAAEGHIDIEDYVLMDFMANKIDPEK